MVKCGRVVFEICERTDRQTYRHAGRNTLYPKSMQKINFLTLTFLYKKLNNWEGPRDALCQLMSCQSRHCTKNL